MSQVPGTGTKPNNIFPIIPQTSYSNYLLDIKPLLHSWVVLQDATHWPLVENFVFVFTRGIGLMIFLSCGIFVWLWGQDSSDLVRQMGTCTILSSFVLCSSVC